MHQPAIEIRQLTAPEGPAFDALCAWMHGWWGVRDGLTPEQVRTEMRHCLNTGNRLPQTFIAYVDGTPAGSYQLSMSDDLESRPDIYPWLISLQVDPAFRGLGVARALLETVERNARAAGLSRLYLYTAHNGFYEKFGWQFVEMVETFRESSPLERLYTLEIASE